MGQKRYSQTGFTMLEILIVIALIVMLAGIVTPLVRSALEDAKVAKVIGLAETLKRASMKYWYDTGQLAIEEPATDVHNLFTQEAGVKNWKGPYTDVPLASSMNPWGGDIQLQNRIGGESGIGNGYSIAGVTITGMGAQLMLDQVPFSAAKKINEILDGSIPGGPSDYFGKCELAEINTSIYPGTCSVFIFLFKSE